MDVLEFRKTVKFILLKEFGPVSEVAILRATTDIVSVGIRYASSFHDEVMKEVERDENERMRSCKALKLRKVKKSSV